MKSVKFRQSTPRYRRKEKRKDIIELYHSDGYILTYKTIKKKQQQKRSFNRTFYNNGALHEIKELSHHNQRDGLYQKWYYNGRIKEWSYWKNGKLNGPKMVWAPDGSILVREYWLNGVNKMI